MKENLIQTSDKRMKDLLNAIDNIAGSKATVLIEGESGTGKELISRYIHSKSLRSSHPFFAINCAALPDNLLESELFGYEKGAFTGADKRQAGKFEAASGSTFLLDEISEMPLLLQAKLLRVLQESEITRLGSNIAVPIDVRVIATSNKSLQQLVKQGKFREDLYYRLNVIPLKIPSLKYRPGDIELLANHFKAIICAENNISEKSFTKEAMDKVKAWNWPGNVRELQNVVERSLLLSSSGELNPEDILIEGFEDRSQDLDFKPGLTVAEMEKNLILRTLDYTSQNRTQAAQLLGISIRTLRNKIREYKQSREIIA